MTMISSVQIWHLNQYQKANRKSSDTNDDLNYRDDGYISEKELQRNMEILFVSLDQIVTIT